MYKKIESEILNYGSFMNIGLPEPLSTTSLINHNKDEALEPQDNELKTTSYTIGRKDLVRFVANSKKEYTKCSPIIRRLLRDAGYFN